MSSINQLDKKIFENLFVLEMANNHWGDIERGKKLIRDFGSVVRHNDVKAAIKLQFRKVDEFIHPEFKGNKEIRYISKTEATALNKDGFAELVEVIKSTACIPMATPLMRIQLIYAYFSIFLSLKLQVLMLMIGHF